MIEKKDICKLETKTEGTYWSLFGHSCSSVIYRVTNQDRLERIKV